MAAFDAQSVTFEPPLGVQGLQLKEYPSISVQAFSGSGGAGGGTVFTMIADTVPGGEVTVWESTPTPDLLGDNHPSLSSGQLTNIRHTKKSG